MTGIKEIQCPSCSNVGKFRTNDDDHIISSCPNCGWKPVGKGGTYYTSSRRSVVKETIKDDGTKIRKVVLE